MWKIATSIRKAILYQRKSSQAFMEVEEQDWNQKKQKEGVNVNKKYI